MTHRFVTPFERPIGSEKTSSLPFSAFAKIRSLYLFCRSKQSLDFDLLKKEVIQPHLPIRLPCYDFTPFTSFTLVVCLLTVNKDHFGCSPLRWCDGRCVQGPGTYSPRHADPRLLAIPTSWSRVADSNPNWDRLLEISSLLRVGNPLYRPL